MTRTLILGALALAFALAPVAKAETNSNTNATFQVLCWYQNDHGSPFGDTCRASLNFTAPVTFSGGEIPDIQSPGALVDAYTVTCDANPYGPPNNPLEPVYNDAGTRSTTGLGTLFMGTHGTLPSVAINRGELHTGVHSAESYLMLPLDNHVWRGVGRCSISGQLVP